MRILQKTGLLIVAAVVLSGCAIIHSKPNLPSRDNVVPGPTITVQGNQNVYAIAREHNVSMRDIIVLNGMQPPYNLRPGQMITLPANTSGGTGGSSSYYGDYKAGIAPAPASSPSGAIESQSLPPIQPAPVQASPLPPAPPVPAAVAPASQPPAPQKQGNLGTLSKPSVTTAPVEALNQPKGPPKPVATTASPPAPASASVQTSSNIQTAQPDSTPALPTPEPPSTTMVWPVQGPILSGFGPKGQGLNNDGINIGAPKGSPVVAASNGIVVYAGSEMKGFGNLVLIRHKDGWVTAYAHLDRMLVQKDAVVAQGDEIGTVGKTGNVPSPQLHFETRYEGKPVDPSTVIKAQ